MAGSSLKLHHQIRPPYFLQRPLHPPSHFPLQLQPHFPVPKSRQPSLKILLILHGFSRRNLCHPSPKPLVLPRFPKRTVHARRTHLQDVARARNQLLHIHDHAELLADTLAIPMANSHPPTPPRPPPPPGPKTTPAASVIPAPAFGTRSMITRKKRCFPTFHSTSYISRPSDRATRSAASRIFSKSNRRLPKQCRCPLPSNRPNKKVGLRPPIRATCFRAKTQYILPSSQMQDTPQNQPSPFLISASVVLGQHSLCL